LLQREADHINSRKALVIGFIVITVSTYLATQQHQPMTIIRLYTGSDGQTHEDNVEVKFTPTTIYLPKGKVLVSRFTE
jgi:hypothetical protein